MYRRSIAIYCQCYLEGFINLLIKTSELLLEILSTQSISNIVPWLNYYNHVCVN